MLRREFPYAYTRLLALAMLPHCEASSSQPSDTPASAQNNADARSSSGTNARASGENDFRAAPEYPSPMSGAKRSSSTTLSDAQIAAITDAANAAEVEQGRLAQSKATDSRVRNFAAMMVDYHNEARRNLQALSVGKTDNPTSERLSREADDALRSLQQKSSAEFDSAYIQLQLEQQQKVLAKLQHQLLPAAADPALKVYLEKMRPTLESHLAQAEDLQLELGSDAPF